MTILQTGDVVSAKAYGFIDHFGIISENGTVISNSKRHGSVVEQSLNKFSEAGPIKHHGKVGPLSRSQTVFNARSRIGQSYELFTNNCEHFIRWASGLTPKSPQLVAAVTLIGGATLIWALSRLR